MKYVFKALKPLNTCWSVGKKVVEMAVRQLCQLCAARVTWYSFHSCTSDAALLCSQCSRGRCPNVPNGHIHAAKFATASSVIKSENDKKIATNISVTGNVSDPKIETHLIADTFMTPVNIIKRTLELPLEVFK